MSNDDSVKNGLGGALGFPGSNLQGALGLAGAPFTPTISTAETLFTNLRYYLVSNLRQVLSQAYAEIGLVQTITDVPVDDGLRGGVDFKSSQLDEEQIKDLKIKLDEDGDIETAGQAGKWNRLFGGAGIIVISDQDPEEPLQLESLDESSNVEFRAVDMWELFWDKQNTEGYDPAIQETGFEHYSYYGEQLHKSRVMRLKGITAPSFIRPRLRGWGFSVVETLVRSMNQYLKATDLTFEVLDEFKLDVFKIKNLVNTLLSPQGEEQIKRRVQMANWQKNYQNALTMDSEDDFDHKQLSFAGMAEVMGQIRMQVAAEMRMPMTKLFGISASGFNSGEDDIEVYNAMVESQVRGKLKYDILRIAKIKCKVLFGFIPDDLEASFKPLRVLGAVEEETVKTQKYTRLVGAYEKGLISVEEFRDACNKGNLYDVVLDNEGLSDELGADDATETGDGEDSDDPGPNRPDSSQSRASGKNGDPKKAPAPRSANDAKSKEAPKEKSVKNAQQRRILTDHIHMFSLGARAERALGNSAAFDRASYEADGGDGWIDDRRKEFFANPGNVDEALWEKAKRATIEALGKENWKFTTWWYKKQEGKF